MYGLLKQCFNISNKEWPRVILLSSFFFFVIANFWVLKSMKKGLMLDWYQQYPIYILGWTLGGPEVEQIAKVFNMFVIYGVIILFTYLSQRFNRQHFVLIVSVFYGFLFLLFGYWINYESTALVWSFFIFGDIFNTTMVTLFWAFTNDLSTVNESKRTYGLIGLGGILGGFIGSTFVESFVQSLGRSYLLYIAVIPMLIIALIGYLLNHYFFKDRTHGQNTDNDIARPGPKSRIVWKGAKLVFNSKYLMSIALIVGLYEIVSNLIDFQLSTIVTENIAYSLNKDAYFAYVGQITNIISFIVQLLLTSFIMQRFGVGVALMFLPVAILATSIGFLISPTLIFATSISASDNSLNYSINQSAKEALYVPINREKKYLAKAFIDMFIQRFAKVLSVGITLSISYYAMVIDIRLITIVMISIIIIWMNRIWYTKQKYKQLTQPIRVSPKNDL